MYGHSDNRGEEESGKHFVNAFRFFTLVPNDNNIRPINKLIVPRSCLLSLPSHLLRVPVRHYHSPAFHRFLL